MVAFGVPWCVSVAAAGWYSVTVTCLPSLYVVVTVFATIPPGTATLGLLDIWKRHVRVTDIRLRERISYYCIVIVTHGGLGITEAEVRGESLVRVDETGTAETTGISSWGGAVGAQSSIIVIVRGGLRYLLKSVAEVGAA